MWLYVFLFFKQKTAYEMRISDWSSDVCSSDLVPQLAASWLDIAGQVIAFADARFCAEGSADAPAFYNLGARHDMAGQVIALHSADAGDTALQTPIDGKPALKLYDFSGQPVTEWDRRGYARSEEHKSELQPLMRNSY